MKIFRPFVKNTPAVKQVIMFCWLVAGLLFWQFLLPSGLSRPLGVWEKLTHQLQNGLVSDFIMSITTITWASLFAFPVACFLAYQYTADIWKPPVRFIASMRNMGTIAVTSALILLRFSGENIKVLTIGFIILVYFVSSLVQQIDGISQERLDLALTMNMSPFQSLWHVVIRGELYTMCANFIPNIGIGWSMLSVAEGVVRAGGIGDLLLQQDKISSMNGIVALAAVTNLAGHMISVIGWMILRKVFRYAASTTVAA